MLWYKLKQSSIKSQSKITKKGKKQRLLYYFGLLRVMN